MVTQDEAARKWLQLSKKSARQRGEIIRRTSLTVEFSGEEHADLIYAMMLNRRMLDRSPEHSILDRALSMVVKKLREAFEEHPNSHELDEIREEMATLWPVAFPEQSKKEGAE